MTTITSITDLRSAVLDLRPDAAAAGAEVTLDHVREAEREIHGGRYEDIDDETLGGIADRAVEIALLAEAHRA